MILLKIFNKITKDKSSNGNIAQIKLHLEKLQEKVILLNKIKLTKNLKSMVGLLKLEKKSITDNYRQNLITYIINIKFSEVNTLINITDIDGNPKLSLSSGTVGLKGKEKRVQPLALISIFKTLLINAKFLSKNPVALHFKNTKGYHESLIINLLKNKIFIKSIRSYNLQPHNGCRPKKLMRLKGSSNR